MSPIIDNSNHFIDIRIVVMTKSISDSRVAWRRFYCNMGRTLRDSEITKNLRFSDSRIPQEKAREATIKGIANQIMPLMQANNSIYGGWPPSCPQSPSCQQCVLLENQHFQDEDARTVRKVHQVAARDDKICICLKTVALLFGNETWVSEESSSGP